MIEVVHYGSQDANVELWTDNGKIKTIINGMNCFGQFIKPDQKLLKQHFPGIMQADRKTMRGDSQKLGSITHCETQLQNSTVKVFNAYVMFDWGSDKNTLNYEALESCLIKVAENLTDDEPISMLDPGYELQTSDKTKIREIIEKVMGDRRILIFIP